MIRAAVHEVVQPVFVEDPRRLHGVTVPAPRWPGGEAGLRRRLGEAHAILRHGVVDLEAAARTIAPEVEVEETAVVHHLGAAADHHGVALVLAEAAAVPGSGKADRARTTG